MSSGPAAKLYVVIAFLPTQIFKEVVVLTVPQGAAAPPAKYYLSGWGGCGAGISGWGGCGAGISGWGGCGAGISGWGGCGAGISGCGGCETGSSRGGGSGCSGRRSPASLIRGE